MLIRAIVVGVSDAEEPEAHPRVYWRGRPRAMLVQ